MSSALFELPRRGRKFILTFFELSVNYFAKIFYKLFADISPHCFHHLTGDLKPHTCQKQPSCCYEIILRIHFVSNTLAGRYFTMQPCTRVFEPSIMIFVYSLVLKSTLSAHRSCNTKQNLHQKSNRQRRQDYITALAYTPGLRQRAWFSLLLTGPGKYLRVFSDVYLETINA